MISKFSIIYIIFDIVLENFYTMEMIPVERVYVDPLVIPFAEAYIKGLTADCDKLLSDKKDKDDDRLLNWAHKVKGNGGIFGIQYISDLGRIIEHYLKMGETDQAFLHIQLLNSYIHSLVLLPDNLEEEDQP
ncbi:Hpt domain-containing protein [Spirochaeta cellobiosiphila]|uniref:Hpt domain-containing protein n=1 Tax=Spirochaeta cellobiosiphila TaxID=504483 RepID=UPI001B7FCF65|nr:Hpt domain-containing protein [Spirochaeta cellobiosiphila]